MGKLVQLSTVAVLVAIIAILGVRSKQYGWEKDEVVKIFLDLKERLGFWAIPLYVSIHTLSLSFCLPFAVFFEGGASLLFGFLPAVFCVFVAKVLAASLSFWIGRAVFRSSSSAMAWVQKSRYFHLVVRGVERDGWKFVLLTRFSPMPSYVINYALAATKVRFLVDFLLPTVLGCFPMILKNTSMGSLASAAIASTTGSQKSHVFSYLLPLIGILSNILISLRIKSYSSEISVAKELNSSKSLSGEDIDECNNTVNLSQDSSDKTARGALIKGH
ncbi:uncharacterized protein LOC143860657 isoform X2 [Tasmannia lanceolata]|uniref:uncharacterized protein LOC143860657 isoform X2 n=1 Tax=Tasmannia lanceolata TaxID=3420 RepID=UPI004063EFFE